MSENSELIRMLEQEQEARIARYREKRKRSQNAAMIVTAVLGMIVAAIEFVVIPNLW